jgi:hypothetical protein
LKPETDSSLGGRIPGQSRRLTGGELITTGGVVERIGIAVGLCSDDSCESAESQVEDGTHVDQSIDFSKTLLYGNSRKELAMRGIR